MRLNAFLVGLSRSAFGRTKADAHRDLMCIRCAEEVDPDAMSDIDAREYAISGVCPTCFSDLTPDEECGE